VNGGVTVEGATVGSYNESLRAMTMLADWLGDIIVYCFSEAARWGIPIESVLMAIQKTNFTKLDADGKPILDEHNKFQKGPFYTPPEPAISQMLNEDIQQNDTTRLLHLASLVAVSQA
jgi:predicted HAD superfamily Cof-like phosphohydrolase